MVVTTLWWRSARRAAAWASQLGIHADLLADITAAARLHDEGKRAAPIQQEYSLVVDETGLLIQRQGEASGAALAKSALPRRMWVRARRLVGNPPYLRHEALSAEAVTPSTGNDPDLVRHLVLAHHGYFRGPGPVIAATTFCPAPAYQDSTTVEWRGWPVVFDHLNRRYGPYSLALAETIIRLADWHESRKIS